MLLAGSGSAYWIRQEGLQLTHLLLVVWVLANFFVLNVRWELMGTAGTRSRARGRRQWSEPDARR